MGWAYPVSVAHCCTREIVSCNLAYRRRTEEMHDAVRQAVLPRLPEGSREASLTLSTGNGTELTSTRFSESMNRLGITCRRTAFPHPKGNSYIERFHRRLEEEAVSPF